MKAYNERQAIFRIMKKPNMPASAFFVFMEEFRKQYKAKHPNNKSVAIVGKARGDKWKSLSDAKKATYIAKAERKVEYEKNTKAYIERQAEGTKEDEQEPEKSMSEVKSEEGDEEGNEEEEADDDEKPNRPASAFFFFMEEFRKQYKAKHPNNKSIVAIGKAGVDKWKSFSDAEKATYIAKVGESKVEHEKNMKAYMERQAGGTKEDEKESEKSMSKVKYEEGNEEEDDEKPMSKVNNEEEDEEGSE